MATLVDALIEANAQSWKDYTRHPFVRQLGDGSLQHACFVHYLKQDYLFLLHFARAHGLAAFKSQSFAQLRHASSSLAGILNVELDLHIAYCQQWGLTAEDLDATVESTANLAYTRYVMERGLAGDLLDLNVALAPCILGYQAVAVWLQQQAFLKREGNPYSDWIAMYASDEYADVAMNHRTVLNTTTVRSLSTRRFSALTRTFGAATRLEIDFWQMALTCR